MTPRIQTIISKMFSAQEAILVSDWVNSLKLRCSDCDQERTILAALRIADGDIHVFQRNLQDAAIDYRDVLINSGLGFANWHDVLTRWENGLLKM